MELEGHEMKHTPTYNEVISAYGLDILKPGDDLSFTTSGDLALTAYGDGKLGDDRFNAMHRLVLGWCFNAPTLTELFKLVSDARARKEQLEDELNNVASTVFDSPASLKRFHAIRDEFGASDFGGGACAGAIMVVLGELLRMFKKDLNATCSNWDKCSPSINGYSFGSIVGAAANNFRHHGDWARRDPPDHQQLVSIRVIAAVLQVSIGEDGMGHPFRHNVCPELLEALSDGNSEELNRKFFAFAKSLAA